MFKSAHTMTGVLIIALNGQMSVPARNLIHL